MTTPVQTVPIVQFVEKNDNRISLEALLLPSADHEGESGS
jgi:hypothetical protein